jgi:hypothetical protein
MNGHQRGLRLIQLAKKMIIIDYNGSGRWSIEEVLRRYNEYVRSFQVNSPHDLTPSQHEEGAKRWVYPIMKRVIEGIKMGDAACIQLGVEFIEEDQKFPFGRILKANTARALRGACLTPHQIERIRQRVITMLIGGHIPREFREYAKLLRKIGVGRWWSGLDERVDRSNRFVMRYYNYFKDHVVNRNEVSFGD